MMLGPDNGDKPQPIILMLVDSHDFTRHCISDLLRHHSRELVVRDVACVDELEPADADGCDAVLMRIDASQQLDQRVRQTMRRLDEVMPGIPVAVLCGLVDLDAALAFVRQGVRACLPPTLSVAQVVAALRLVMTGGVYIGPTEAPAAACGDGAWLALGVPEPQMPATMATAALTPRETEVLSHLQQGKPNKVIAYDLGMSENTVKVHVGRILKKLNAMNRTALACGAALAPSSQALGGYGVSPV